MSQEEDVRGCTLQVEHCKATDCSSMCKRWPWLQRKCCRSSIKAHKYAGPALTHSRICDRYMRMPAGSAADEPPAPLEPAPLLPAPLPPAPLEPAASVGGQGQRGEHTTCLGSRGRAMPCNGYLEPAWKQGRRAAVQAGKWQPVHLHGDSLPSFSAWPPEKSPSSSTTTPEAYSSTSLSTPLHMGSSSREANMPCSAFS